MKVLIGCEESQTVCKEFRKLGHEAYSCDLKPCSGGHPEWHIQRDILQVIDNTPCCNKCGQPCIVDHNSYMCDICERLYPLTYEYDVVKWDFIGLHPVCTKMTLSGNRHYAPGKPKYQERINAVEWTIALWEKACKLSKSVYMENPMGAMNGDKRLPIPQIVHPYYFGDEFQKTTCLWLFGLPKLFHARQSDLFTERTHVNKGEMWIAKSGKVLPKWYADTPSTKSEENRTIRSKTFPGIAKAMAEQWSEYLTQTTLF